ncbi:hypothetical protein DASC09_021710 [Saccharomycopsis crataegensis]|uniref:Membrane transport protein MMPL domain-containing protein n=1 Tax=Saccharomycopsis crataegensis TaxID=43959 RepID=A0AAV5QJP9_9ASCO|nr:hypothetical protein DASC09_021710 [Saccharomycopsis crataegensis]
MLSITILTIIITIIIIEHAIHDIAIIIITLPLLSFITVISGFSMMPLGRLSVLKPNSELEDANFDD